MLSGIAICYLRTVPGRRRLLVRRRKYNGSRHIDITPRQEDSRLEELRRWLLQFENLRVASLSPASADASFRRYFRVRTTNSCLIAMDAPPDREDCAAFVRVAGFLERIGLNAPRIVQADPTRGFLLLTDLGSRQYLDELRERPERAEELYGAALAALQRLKEQGRRFQAELPPYNARLLSLELSLFRDWLCGRYLGIEFGAEDEADWRSTVDLLIRNAAAQPQVFVHRDFHSRNLMVTETHRPGILDFQDAVEGPITYDLVSLLKDCYIRWPAAQVLDWAMRFHAAVAAKDDRVPEAARFIQHFELMGVHRQLKAAGIFVRLYLRDGKSGYLQDVPRTLEYIVEVAPRHRDLAFLGRLIEDRCLPALGKIAPTAESAATVTVIP